MDEAVERNKYRAKYDAFGDFSRQKLLSLNTIDDVVEEFSSLVHILDTITNELVNERMNTTGVLHDKIDDVHRICVNHGETIHHLWERTGMRFVYILKQMTCIDERDLERIEGTLAIADEDTPETCLMGVIKEIFKAKNNYIDKMLKDEKIYYARYKEVTEQEITNAKQV